MRRIYLVFLLCFFIFLLTSLKETDKYKGNTWGNKYVLEENSSFYIDKKMTNSIYTLKKGMVVYCYDKNNTDLSFFCWYVFENEEEPLSGWIEKDSLMNGE